MDTLGQDLRFALRLLWKDRAFALTTLLTLAVCIGANASILTLVRSVLLRPLPYERSDRIVFSYDAFPGAGVERAATSVPNYLDRCAFTDVFDSVALFQYGGFRVGQGAGAEGVASLNVTPSFFRVLRASAARGRLLTEGEGTIGQHRVAVLSHAFAARQPGGVNGVVGRDLRLDDEPHVIVGVLPEGFHFLNPEVAVWVPLAFTEEQRSEGARYRQTHEQIARLQDGVTLAQAQARIDALNARLLEQAGPMKSVLAGAGYTTRMAPLGDDLVRNVRRSLHLLWGGVIVVLLIAAVNVTNLSLVRANGRAKELATRHALGAGRGRIVRQLVTETTLLTVAGSVLGLLLGAWALDALPWLGLAGMPRIHEVRIDATVVAVTALLALVLGAVVGTVPALRLGGADVQAALREESRSGTAGRSARRVRRVLVGAQVALAFVLLVAAALLLTSFTRLLAVDPGFSAEGVLTGRVSPLETRYPDDNALRSYSDRALARLRALPGVQDVGMSSFLPFSWDGSSSVIVPEGYVEKPGSSVVSPNQLYVTPGYLEALRVPLRRGRLFTESDTSGSPRVIIVDERLAERFWPGQDAIGRRVFMPDRPEDIAKPGPDVTWMEVVGVVAPVKLKSLVEEGEVARAGAYYIPYAQVPRRYVGFAIRTSGDPAALTGAAQRTLAEIDPEMPLYDVFAMSERVHRSLDGRRAPMLLSLGFGAVALLLAAIGLYGVLAYQVGQRTREIGIRMALGSDARGILRLVLHEGALLVGIGLLAGLVGLFVVHRFIASQLYGIGALDPHVIGSVSVVLALASLAACLGPARRAARVNAVEALTQP
jgi:predicted permease